MFLPLTYFVFAFQLLISSRWFIGTESFVPFNPQTSSSSIQVTTRTTRRQQSELHMVFDFFKQRSEEGLAQLSKLSDAASKGKFGEGLVDIAEYTRVTNQAFANGLAKSRNRLLSNLESILSGSGGEDALENLEDILLQADLGTATAEDIVAEVRLLRDDSTKFLSREDLLSVMRGKLMETLETTEDQGSIRFSSDPSIPTVLFVLGANGMGK